MRALLKPPTHYSNAVRTGELRGPNDAERRQLDGRPMVMEIPLLASFPLASLARIMSRDFFEVRTQRNRLLLLINLTEVILYLPFSNWFWTKRDSVCLKINRGAARCSPRSSSFADASIVGEGLGAVPSYGHSASFLRLGIHWRCSPYLGSYQAEYGARLYSLG